ncbi:MAG TPA: S41 family peptidase, partial [bacterium]|nr:S41 family peptidase [bacterium]
MFRCPRPFLVLPLSVAWLGTAPVPAAAAPLTADQCREVVRAVGQSLMDGYVIPETAETMRDALERRLADGDFAGLDDAVLAGELTRILHELSHDLHLKVNVGGAAPPVAVEKRVVGVNGDEEPEEGEPVAVPAGLQQVDAFPEARMLAGNVGYVPVTLFRDLPGDRELAARRMAAVAGADALIFDLRGCMGGFPSMVHFVTSYLYDGEPRHLLTYYHAEGEPDSAYTFEDVPGERLPDADVYILTSSYTASGGEEFTHTLKHHGRATVVGTRTAGAGHGGGVHPLPHGFSMFLPVFRPVHPVTGGGWEDRGVLPDVEVPSSRALEV